MTIKKNDFIEIEYTGRTKEDQIIFDTTDEAVAKANHLHSHNQFGPATICIGENQILPGIDVSLEGKEVGKEYVIEVGPEDGFGKKDAKLIQMMQAKKFKEQNIDPQPGLQINMDGVIGTVKTVSGGRVMMDFNHPLAGKELEYRLRVNKKVEDDKDKLQGYMKQTLGMHDFSSEIKEGTATVKLKMPLPEEVQTELNKKISALIPGIKKVEFSIAKEEKK